MASHLEPGCIVAGEFRVERLLAEGGMGSVYVVDQIATGKRRALKLMHRSARGDLELRRRFEQEARVGALIPSEHVVDVIASGVHGEYETPWLVMELLDGEDLEAYLTRRGALPVLEAAEILRQLCHGLAAAHGIPIVHRDLKPENVFLAKSRLASARYLVKILDFGIAKIVGHGAGSTQQMGTPMWMAPEQTDSAGRIGPQADVWSLGLVAFRVLTGRSYWKSALLERVEPAAVLREMLITPLVPASERAREVGGVALPDGFDAWFAQCVCRDLDARLHDAGAAWELLAPVLGATAELGLRSEPPPALDVGSSPELDLTVPSEFFAAALPNDTLVRSTQHVVTSPIAEPSGHSRPKVALAAVAVMIALGAIGFALSSARGARVTASSASSALPSAAPVLTSSVPSASVVAVSSASSLPAAVVSADGGPVSIPAAASSAVRAPRPASSVRRTGTAAAPDFL